MRTQRPQRMHLLGSSSMRGWRVSPFGTASPRPGSASRRRRTRSRSAGGRSRRAPRSRTPDSGSLSRSRPRGRVAELHLDETVHPLVHRDQRAWTLPPSSRASAGPGSADLRERVLAAHELLGLRLRRAGRGCSVSMAWAALRPAAIASIAVAAPVTTSPPENTPSTRRLERRLVHLDRLPAGQAERLAAAAGSSAPCRPPAR